MSMVVGTTGDTEALVDLIRYEAGAASTQIRFVNAVSMSDYIEPEKMRSWRLGASVFTAFGFLALIVAGWGLYSVLAFDVALRQHELSIRSALGANVARLVRLVLRQAVLVVLAGVGIGLSASWAAARLVEPLRSSRSRPRIQRSTRWSGSHSCSSRRSRARFRRGGLHGSIRDKRCRPTEA